MSKRIIRVLSMVLTLVMMLSLSTPAFAWGGIDTGKGWDRQIGEDDFREIEPAEEVEEEEVFDYFQTYDEDSEIQVTVEAPMGVLPSLAELRVEPVEIEEVREAVEKVMGDEANILLAADISFWMNGIEIEPEDEVRVKITSPALVGVPEYQVIHIPDDASAEAEELNVINEDELSFAVSSNEVAFRASEFSTFVVSSYYRDITVHHGYVDNSGFHEFANGSSSDSTYPSGISYSNGNEYVFLTYDFEGYKYKETHLSRYNGTQIWPVLQLYNYRYYYSNYGTRYFENRIPNDGNIYLIYEKKADPTTAVDTSGQEQGSTSPVEVPDLPAGKTVSDNGNGTYDITLSVTGVQAQQETISRANIIVVFDTSGSMLGDMDGNSTNVDANRRLTIAKKAVISLASTVLADDKVDQEGNKLAQIALIPFDTAVGTITPYTDDLATFTSAVNSLTTETSRMTNWEDALAAANQMAASQTSPTYVIFVSDGDPTIRSTRLDKSDAQLNVNLGNVYTNVEMLGLFEEGYVISNNRYVRQTWCYDAAVPEARSIVTHNKLFYTIGLSNDATRMQAITNAAYGGTAPADHYFPATSEQELKTAFDAIAKAVTDNFGFSEVTVDDGVTDLTTVETSALTGKPENFVYRKGTHTGDEISQNEIWTGAPEADITDDNHVVWDTSEIGTLEPGVTYSVTFTVWPSQQSYDIIADINNGIIRNPDGTVKETTTKAAAYAAQPESVRNQIVQTASGDYTLVTNTGLNVSYKFNGAPGEKEVTDYENGSMPLDTTYFSMTKDWKNQLPQDSRTAQVLTKEDTDGKKYLVNSKDEWILDEDENKIEYGKDFDNWDKAVYFVDLIVTKKGADYTEVRLTSEDQTADGGNGPWEWNQMFVAPGVLTYDKSLTKGAFTLRETGDDYTVKEKPSEYYYWELYAETYHPMVINGEACVLQLVTNESEVPSDVKGAENANKFNGDYFNIGGVVYKKLGSADDATISAVNERRSYLNLTKVVNGDNAPADTYFTYTVKMENPNGLYEGENGYSVDNDDFWFSIYDPVNKETVKDSSLVTGATAEEGNTGYWHFANVKGGKTITIKIKAGWNVRFTNLFTGTTYEFEEPIQEMDDGFIFNKVEASAVKDGTALEDYNPTIADTKINGEITQPNTDFTVTYTNDYAGFFYVYHSSDNTIERYPLAENGKEIYVDGKTFDIAHLTKAGSLYGGYYKDYKNKGISDEEILKLTSFPYTDDKGTAYAGATDVWEMKNAYGVSGLTMVPVVNTVYYLKEVPDTKYLRPYLHYTYKLTNNEITASWLISDVDDANYKNTGFVVTNDADKEDKAKVVASLKVTNTNNGNYIKLTPTIVFDADGYLTYVEVMRNSAALTEETGFQAGCKVQEFWVTPDGLFVTGITLRTYGVINDHDDINNAATDDEVSSSITVYTAP